MSSSVRAFPPAAALAIIGGAAGLLALLLPWFAFDAEGMLQFAKALGIDTAVAQAQNVSPEQLQQQLASQLKSMEAAGTNGLVGYRVFSPITVVAQGLAGAAAIWAALQMMGGARASSLTGPLIGGGVVLGGRAIYGLTQVPGTDELGQLGIEAQLFSPAIGLWVGLGAGIALLVAAALATMEGSAEATNGSSTEWMPAAGAVPGSAHVPGGMTSATPAPAAYMPAAPATAYAPPPAPAHGGSPVASPGGPHVAMPSQYTPGGGYGDSGPGTLDRDSRLVRPNDPYAPTPRAVPAVPIMPAPANVAPVGDAPPAVDPPGAIYGVPRPAPAPTEQGAPTRPGSTAPPGFA